MKVYLDTSALIALSGLPQSPLQTDFVGICKETGIVFCVSTIQVDEKVDREMPTYGARIEKAVRELTRLGLQTSLEPTGVTVFDATRWDMSKLSGELESGLYRTLVEMIRTCNQEAGKPADSTRDAIIGVSALDHDLFIVCDKCLYESFLAATSGLKNLRDRLPVTILRKPTPEDITKGILQHRKEVDTA